MTPRFAPIIDITPSAALPRAGLSATYWLLALAMLTTAAGVVLGALFALPILTSGWMFIFFLAELALVWTAPRWVHRSPLNIALFFAVPLLSGLTVTPFLLSVATGYVNGALILLNATIATIFLAAAAAVYASVSRANLLQSIGFYLFQAVIGLLVIGILQLFFPMLRSSPMELLVSGIGIIVFTLFLAVDIQRVRHMDRSISPFLLALSLYLDVFNLFLFVVRFMVTLSGRER